MKNEGAIEAAPRAAGPSPRLIAASAAVVMAAYTVTIRVANEVGWSDAVRVGVANAAATILAGIVAFRVVATLLVGRRPIVLALGHSAVGAGFALLTYWLLMVIIGLMNGVSFVEFTVEPFPSRAATWQTMENVTIYGIVAALAHLHARPEPVALLLGGGAPEATDPLSRYFIRSGDDIRPIDVATIVTISGADDYAEVATTAGRHLVRMTLAQFEKALDPARFIRVHRSRIVNVERIERAEPAGGGRLLLHMEGGETIVASRAGSRLLRDRVI